MSMTLRDAQHLCWKNFRKINDRLENSKKQTPFAMVADMVEETGRVASVVKNLEGLDSSEKQRTKEALAIGLSNLVYTIFVLGENYGIQLEESFMQAVNDKIMSSVY